jgi:Carboxypeptidase regulatory-like domain
MKRIALLLLFAPHVFAAVSTSALTGRVTSAGKPVANATVTATSPALQAPRVTTTGASGTYWLGALPPGQYDVTFAHAGLQSLTRRAVVELARIARADAQLEPSEDEESVTSTATTISVVHDTALSTHRNAKQLDQLPVPIDYTTVLYLDPDRYPNAPTFHDDGGAIQSETIDEMTFIRAVTPLELARTGSATAVVARTRTGGEEFSFSARDTITNGGNHYGEVASGGRIIPDRLWFFGAGWDGKRVDRFPFDERGFELKLTAQLDERQNLTATHTDSFAGLTSIDHVAQWTPRVLTEISATHAQGFDQNIGSAKTSFVAGDHVLSAGIEGSSGYADTHAFFVNDRLWHDRWLLNSAVRYGRFHGLGDSSAGPAADGDGFSSQVAGAYDLRGRGRNAITASATRYAFYGNHNLDEFTVGYVMALGSTGSARFDVIHDDYEGQTSRTRFQLDSNYRLFDRFEAGLNYTYTRSDFDYLANTGNAWLSADMPMGDQTFGVMIAYRYGFSPFVLFAQNSPYAVDLALRYTIPVKRIAMTVAADAQSVLNNRIVRGWIRLRL